MSAAKILSGLLAGALLTATPVLAQDGPLLIHAGQLLAVPGDAPRARQTVIVRDGKIAGIRDGFAQPVEIGMAGARVVDLSQAFVLPGLIDLHVHITRERSPRSTVEAFTKTPGDVALDAAYFAEKTLQAGFTTVRDLGSPDRTAAALRDSIDAGRLPGPTVLVAGQMISVTAGHGDVNGVNEEVMEALHRVSVCDGADDCRRAVREQVKRGADVIKFAATGGVMSRIAAGTDQQLFDDEIQAIVDTAHLYGKKVTVHAHGAGGIKAALRAGVDSVEHGSFQDAETIRLFKQTGAWYIPTLHAGWTAMEMAKQPGFLSAEQREKTLKVGPALQDTFAKAHKAGINIAFGTDCGVGLHGTNAKEFELMVQAGMPAAQAIRTATVNAAIAQGIQDRVGTLEPGKDADIIAVTSDPLDDITALQQVDFVMRRGTIHKLGGQRQAFQPAR